MAINRVDLIDSLAICRGSTYNLWEPQLQGDYTLWTPKLEIRTTYLEDDGELLASFQFAPSYYDSGTGLTTFLPYLTPAQTLLIPPTGYQGGTATPSARNCWRFDWQIELDGAILTPAGGFVQVKKEVTQNA